MKKKRSKPNKRNTSAAQRTTAAPPQDESRRAFLSRSGKYAIGAVVLGGSAVFGVGAVRATAYEQDVGRVGQGVPTVVQIHDPNCPLCASLQKATRKALKGFDPSELDYVVANVKTDEGRAFANAHGQLHVTLMLMDPSGQPMRILNGQQDSQDLRRIFEAHAAAYR